MTLGKSRGTVNACWHTCPACGTDLWGITVVDMPAICIVCRAVLILDADETPLTEVGTDRVVASGLINIRLRMPTDAEEQFWLADERVQRGIAFVAEYHAEHGSPSPILRPGDGAPPANPRPPY